MNNTYYIEITDISSDEIIYVSYLDGNGKYLEKEDNPGFKILSLVTDIDNGTFCSDAESFKYLLKDLLIILEEAKKDDDIRMVNHIKEIIVLTNLCLWNSSGVFKKVSFALAIVHSYYGGWHQKKVYKRIYDFSCIDS